jgi:hypothetical protein
MKRLLTILLPVLALPLLGGCAIAPDYRYSDSGDGGYYYGEAPYGGADTVIYGSGYGGYYNPWGYGGYYGSSYWGPRFGTSIYYYDRGHRYYRGHNRGHDYRGSGQHRERVQRTRPRGDWDGRGQWRAPTRWRGNPGNSQSQRSRTTSPSRTQSTSRPSVRSSTPRTSRPAAAPRGRAIPKSALPDD